MYLQSVRFSVATRGCSGRSDKLITRPILDVGVVFHVHALFFLFLFLPVLLFLPILLIPLIIILFFIVVSIMP